MTAAPEDSPNRGHRTFKGFPLYPFQERAVDAIDRGDSVIVAAPTGAGKTLIAEYAIEKALETGHRVVYTSPVKALSNQKYRDFGAAYPEHVGIMTGDVTMNPGGSVLIMTTEIFRNTLFEDPERLRDIRYVIFDEIHYLDDPDRGTVWEESLIFAPPEIGVIALSATISNLDEFAQWIREIRDTPLELVRMTKRPVPLVHHLYTEEFGLQDWKKVRGTLKRPPKRARKRFDILDHVQSEKLLPALYFCFSRKACEIRARDSRRRDLLNGREQARIVRLFESLCDRYQVGHFRQIEQLRRMVQRGIAYHHAGMLPTFKEIVERLFTSGLLKLLFTTETFALGVNMPARSVIFESLRKFNGVTFVPLSTIDYYQMAGRAGRQGIDTKGHVFGGVNLRFDTYATLRDTIHGELEPVVSRFNLAYSTLLNLYSRLGERIFDASEKSFAKVQKTPEEWDETVETLAARLEVLRRTGYLDDDGKLTEKGTLCALVNGFEIPITEMYYAGVYEGLGPVELVMLFVAIVYEPRRRDDASDPRSARMPLAKRAKRALRNFRREEREMGLDESVRELCFDLSRASEAWAEGAPFDSVGRGDIGDGDLVRTFRLAIQLMRQLRKATDDEELKSRLSDAVSRINRDVVDAERQLNLGRAIEASESDEDALGNLEDLDDDLGDEEFDDDLEEPEASEASGGDAGASSRDAGSTSVGAARRESGSGRRRRRRSGDAGRSRNVGNTGRGPANEGASSGRSVLDDAHRGAEGDAASGEAASRGKRGGGRGGRGGRRRSGGSGGPKKGPRRGPKKGPKKGAKGGRGKSGGRGKRPRNS